jgi:ABC-type multidrug transport system fused ATPase/permease subunit
MIFYREISVIFQDFMRYEMTARDNIAVGQIDQLRDLESLKLAAGKSMANEVIERLPRDYEQMLGRRLKMEWTSPAENGKKSPWRGLTCATRNY